MVKKWLARALPFIITILLVRFLISQGGDLRRLQEQFQQLQLGWLLTAILLQAGVFGAITWLNLLFLRAYGVSVPWLRQYFIQLTMAFVETVIPSAMVSGLVLRAWLLKPYGASADVAVVTTMVETGFIALSVVALALPVALVMLTGRIWWWLLILSLILAIIWEQSVKAGWRYNRLVNINRSLLDYLTGLWDHQIIKRWPQQFAAWSSRSLLQRIRYLWQKIIPLLRNRPYELATALLLRTVCEAIAFAVCFYAFGKILPLLTLLLLYIITISVNILGGLPGGVGLAEVSLASIYLQFGIPLESAVAVALIYRFTGYWLPRLVGGLAWLWLEWLHHPDSQTQDVVL